MRSQLLEANNHHQYLKDALASPEFGRGSKTKLAEALKCRAAFISQVMAGKNVLTLEMAFAASRFLNHIEAETSFFILLVNRDRAGTASLRKWFDQKLTAQRQRYKRVESRITGDSLTNDDAGIYYSQWWYAAIHIVCGTPGRHTPSSIAQRLRLPLEQVQESLMFLEMQKLVDQEHGAYKIGKRRLHIRGGSYQVGAHHANWRIKTIAAPADNKFKPLRYTGVLAFSYEDAERIRERLLTAIQDCEKILADTNEEDAFSLILDFSRV